MTYLAQVSLISTVSVYLVLRGAIGTSSRLWLSGFQFQIFLWSAYLPC